MRFPVLGSNPDHAAWIKGEGVKKAVAVLLLFFQHFGAFSCISLRERFFLLTALEPVFIGFYREK